MKYIRSLKNNSIQVTKIMNNEDLSFTDAPKVVKVYVGCGLTNAPAEFKQEVESLKVKLKEFCVILDFLGLTAGTPRDVWTHDIARCVMQCDLFVAICDHPSTGLGVEFGVQTMVRQKPTIAAAHYDSLVTRLVLDPEVLGDFKFVRYSDLSELVPIIRASVDAIREGAYHHEHEKASMCQQRTFTFTQTGVRFSYAHPAECSTLPS